MADAKLALYKDTFFGKAPHSLYIPIIIELEAIGCCPRCSFRFVNQRNLALYQEKSEFLRELVQYIKQAQHTAAQPTTPPLPNSTTPSNEVTSTSATSATSAIPPTSLVSESNPVTPPAPPTTSHSESSDTTIPSAPNTTTHNTDTSTPSPSASSTSTHVETESKSPCIACFGILDGATSTEFISSFVDKLSNTGQYSLWLHLRTKFGTDLFKSASPDETVVDVKEGLKWILGPMLARKLGLTFKNGADFRAALTFKHPETQEEHAFLSELDETVKPRKNKKQQWKADLAWESINSMSRTLRKINPDKFKKSGYCPPKPVTTTATYDLVYEHAAVFIAGRYNKFTRNVSQTPWIMPDGTTRGDSVDQFIVPTIMEYFKCDEVKFSASGREDIDVRMLGDGRPFMLELANARRVFFDHAIYREMEQKINSHPSQAVIINRLQRIPKSLTNKLKDGEEQKRKTYRSVVWIEKEVTPKDLQFLNDLKDLEISQKTPVRVLHRRSLSDRKRTIHWMSYEYINPHFAILNLCTQAGTYVKEFVHGDLGRTVPNLGSLLNCQADVS